MNSPLVRKTLNLLSVGLLLLSLACTKSPGVDVADYVTRLARVLESESPPVDDVTLTAFPRVRDLRLDYESAGIGLLDFLAISDCRLQAVVAEKNSSLGRVADAVYLLKSELDFLRYAGACVERLAIGQADLAAELEAVIAHKRDELPGRIFDATIGGDAFRAFWQSDNLTIDAQLLETMDQLQADIQRWRSGDYRFDASLDRRLQLISQSGAGGLLRDWQAVSRDLPAATAVARRRNGDRPLCYPDMKTPEAEAFLTVVKRFFVAGIQRSMAQTNRAAYELMPRIHSLEGLIATQTVGYQAWAAERDAMISSGRAALVEHVEALEPLMRQCGLLPRMPENPEETS